MNECSIFLNALHIVILPPEPIKWSFCWFIRRKVIIMIVMLLSSRVWETPWPAAACCCCCGWSEEPKYTSKWLLAIVYLISLPGNGGGFSCGAFISCRCATRHTWLRAAMHAWTANKAQHALHSDRLLVAIALMAINHRRNFITCYPTSWRCCWPDTCNHTHTAIWFARLCQSIERNARQIMQIILLLIIPRLNTNHCLRLLVNSRWSEHWARSPVTCVCVHGRHIVHQNESRKLERSRAWSVRSETVYVTFSHLTGDLIGLIYVI